MLNSVPTRVSSRNVRAIAIAAMNPFRFKQRYAEAVIRQTARKAGHKIVGRNVSNDGSVTLTIRT